LVWDLDVLRARGNKGEASGTSWKWSGGKSLIGLEYPNEGSYGSRERDERGRGGREGLGMFQVLGYRSDEADRFSADQERIWQRYSSPT
jgi:hypothetical protein